MNKRPRKITDRDQRVAADILCQFCFINDLTDFNRVYEQIFAEYGLMDDPFTHTPVTTEEYLKSKTEYEKQLREDVFE